MWAVEARAVRVAEVVGRVGDWATERVRGWGIILFVGLVGGRVGELGVRGVSGGGFG